MHIVSEPLLSICLQSSVRKLVLLDRQNACREVENISYTSGTVLRLEQETVGIHQVERKQGFAYTYLASIRSGWPFHPHPGWASADESAFVSHHRRLQMLARVLSFDQIQTAVMPFGQSQVWFAAIAEKDKNLLFGACWIECVFVCWVVWFGWASDWDNPESSCWALQKTRSAEWKLVATQVHYCCFHLSTREME